MTEVQVLPITCRLDLFAALTHDANEPREQRTVSKSSDNVDDLPHPCERSNHLKFKINSELNPKHNVGVKGRRELGLLVSAVVFRQS